MFHYYQKSYQEECVERLFLSRGISKPEHLTIDNLSSAFGVTVDYVDFGCMMIKKPNGNLILLDKNLSSIEAKEAFFHELCHVIRHEGCQTSMPDSFRKYQEAQTKQFILYASMPFYMIQQIDWPQYNNQIISKMAYVFDTRYELAKERVEQIKQRIKQQRKIKVHSTTKQRWSSETNRLLGQLKQQIQN